MDISNLPGRNKIIEYSNEAPKKPLVSVCVTAYNHEKFIEQCLDSILEQRTDFDYEILLGEDDSNDDTRKICKQYADKYPDKIRLFLHDRSNVIKIGGQPTGRYNFLYNLSQARGKYIALCDGDDYWTDKHKLQKQVDFMNSHKDYSLCFHPVSVIGDTKQDLFPASKPSLMVEELLDHNYIQTNSVMYRKQKYGEISTDTMPGDLHLHLYHAQFGKIGYIDDVMSVYRRHPGGIWWKSNGGNQSEFWAKHGVSQMVLYGEMLKMYGSTKKYKDIIMKHIVDGMFAIFNMPESEQKRMYKELGERASDLQPVIIEALHNSYDRIVKNQGREINRLNELNTNKDEAISSIRRSLTYRVVRKLYGLLGKRLP